MGSLASRYLLIVKLGSHEPSHLLNIILKHFILSEIVTIPVYITIHSFCTLFFGLNIDTVTCNITKL